MNDFSQHFPLRVGRTHEACGPGAACFAFSLVGHLGGTVLWIKETWQVEQINPQGFSLYLDPSNLLISKAKDQVQVLAVAEEALRAGVFSVVVMELSKPVGLTAGRRLQLAAKEGKSRGLCLLPEGLGSNAAETRWRCAPIFDPMDSTLQRWHLIKNKIGTLKTWDVRWDVETHRIIMVSEIANGSVS